MALTSDEKIRQFLQLSWDFDVYETVKEPDTYCVDSFCVLRENFLNSPRPQADYLLVDDYLRCRVTDYDTLTINSDQSLDFLLCATRVLAKDLPTQEEVIAFIRRFPEEIQIARTGGL